MKTTLGFGRRGIAGCPRSLRSILLDGTNTELTGVPGFEKDI